METLRPADNYVRLKDVPVRPNEILGQHFLIDSEALKTMADQVTPGALVVEIGPGTGNLTRAIAPKASTVIGIEIDRRFEGALEAIQNDFPNVQVIWETVLNVHFNQLIAKRRRGEEAQLVANLPYHIVEPLLDQLARTDFDSLSLLVGKRLALTIFAANEHSLDYTKLTVLVNTFFQAELIAEVEKQKFYPVPKTDGAILRLIPREDSDYKQNPRLFLLKELFLAENKYIPVKESLKRALINLRTTRNSRTLSKREANRKTRRVQADHLRHFTLNDDFVNSKHRKSSRQIMMTPTQALELISQLGLREDCLKQPFSRMTNSDVRTLVSGLNSLKAQRKLF